MQIPLLALNDAYEEMKRIKPNCSLAEYREAVRAACIGASPVICETTFRMTSQDLLESLLEEEGKKLDLKSIVDKIKKGAKEKQREIGAILSKGKPLETIRNKLKQVIAELENKLKSTQVKNETIESAKKSLIEKYGITEGHFESIEEGWFGNLLKKAWEGTLSIGKATVKLLGKSLLSFIFHSTSSYKDFVCAIGFVLFFSTPSALIAALIPEAGAMMTFAITSVLLWMMRGAQLMFTQIFDDMANPEAAYLRKKFNGNEDKINEYLRQEAEKMKIGKVEVEFKNTPSIDNSANVDFSAIAKGTSADDKERTKEKFKKDMLDKVKEIRDSEENEDAANRKIEQIAKEYQEKWDKVAEEKGWRESNLHDAPWYSKMMSSVSDYAKKKLVKDKEEEEEQEDMMYRRKRANIGLKY